MENNEEKKPRRKTRRDQGRKTFSLRDKRGIVLVAEQKATRLDHLGQWLAPDLAAAIDQAKRNHATRQLVAKWEDRGYVSTFRPWDHEPIWIMAKPLAFREFGLPYQSLPVPVRDDLPHLFEITRVRLQLAAAQQSVAPHLWIPERTLAAELLEASPGISQPHLPDGVLQLTNSGKRAIAIEVELSIKSYAELDRIFHDLLDHYTSLWYFCNKLTYGVIEHARAQYPDDVRPRMKLFYLDDPVV